MSSTIYEYPEIIWEESVEKILSELGDEAQINAFLHKKSNEYYNMQNIKYQFPIIIFSAISGTGNFISSTFPDHDKTIVLFMGGLSIITTIITSLAQFLKVSQLSESHRISYLSWEKFHSNIKFQLNKRRSSRENVKDFLNLIVPEYQRLKEISASIPIHITDEVKKHKKNFKNMQVPYMLNGFHPVVPFKEEELTNDDETNNNGLINIDNLNLDNNNNYNTNNDTNV
jgi:hypothetical protein